MTLVTLISTPLHPCSVDIVDQSSYVSTGRSVEVSQESVWEWKMYKLVVSDNHVMMWHRHGYLADW